MRSMAYKNADEIEAFTMFSKRNAHSVMPLALASSSTVIVLKRSHVGFHACSVAMWALLSRPEGFCSILRRDLKEAFNHNQGTRKDAIHLSETITQYAVAQGLTICKAPP